MNNHYLVEDNPVSKFLFSNTKMSWLWLVLRLYVGYEWLIAGWGKIHNVAWVGVDSGKAVAGFVNGALAKTSGPHPDVQGWYAWFLENAVLPNPDLWAYVISYGELLVGIGLIVGALTGIAAFFGLFMNLNFLLAGTISVNPILFVCSIGLILAWKIAGYWGVDRWLLPLFGTPWSKKEELPKNL